MRLLSFDTSSRLIEVCLVEDGRVIFERSLGRETAEETAGVESGAKPHRQESATILLPEIDEAFKQVEWRKKSLDAIVVGAGPGSFTGVRVSTVTARGIGHGLNRGVIPINSLEATALDYKSSTAVIKWAGAGSFFAAVLEPKGGDVLATSEPFMATGADLAQKLKAVEAESAKLEIIADPDCIPPLSALGLSLKPTQTENLARNAALLAWHRLEKAGLLSAEKVLAAFDWKNVLPLYLRGPSVTLKTSFAP